MKRTHPAIHFLSKNPLLLTLFIAFCLIFLMSLFTPRITDDYCNYIPNCQTLSAVIIQSAEAAYETYFEWVGSPFIFFFTILFCTLPKIVFDLFLALAYVALIWLICKNITGLKIITWKLFAFLAIALFLIAPVIGQTVFWITGSFYCWTLVPALGLLLFYRLYDENPPIFKYPVLLFGILFPISIFVGNIHGAVGGVCFLVIIGYMIYWKYRKLSIPLWGYAGLGGIFLGLLMMMLSPGNLSRSAQSVGNRDTLTFGIDVLKQYFHIGRQVIPIILIWVFAFCLNFRVESARKKILSLIYIIPMFFGIGALGLVPAASRSFFFIAVFVLIGAGIFTYSKLNESLFQKHQRLILITFFILFGCVYLSRLYCHMQLNRIFVAREEYIRAEIQKGHKEIIIPTYEKFIFWHQAFALSEVQEGPWPVGYWSNSAMAKAFGADTIIGCDVPEQYNFYEQIKWLKIHYNDTSIRSIK